MSSLISSTSNLDVQQGMCAVCNVPSDNTHVHYGALTCFSCRAFFRRAHNNGSVKSGGLSGSIRYTCKAEARCDVTDKNRKKCQRCRYEKCITVGMNPSLVLSEDQKRVRFRKMIERRGVGSVVNGQGGSGGGGIDASSTSSSMSDNVYDRKLRCTSGRGATAAAQSVGNSTGGLLRHNSSDGVRHRRFDGDRFAAQKPGSVEIHMPSNHQSLPGYTVPSFGRATTQFAAQPFVQTPLGSHETTTSAPPSIRSDNMWPNWTAKVDNSQASFATSHSALVMQAPHHFPPNQSSQRWTEQFGQQQQQQQQHHPHHHPHQQQQQQQQSRSAEIVGSPSSIMQTYAVKSNETGHRNLRNLTGTAVRMPVPINMSQQRMAPQPQHQLATPPVNFEFYGIQYHPSAAANYPNLGVGNSSIDLSGRSNIVSSSTIDVLPDESKPKYQTLQPMGHNRGDMNIIAGPSFNTGTTILPGDAEGSYLEQLQTASVDIMPVLIPMSNTESAASESDVTDITSTTCLPDDEANNAVWKETANDNVQFNIQGLTLLSATYSQAIQTNSVRPLTAQRLIQFHKGDVLAMSRDDLCDIIATIGNQFRTFAMRFDRFSSLPIADQRVLLTSNVPMYVHYILAQYFSAQSGRDQIAWLLSLPPDGAVSETVYHHMDARKFHKLFNIFTPEADITSYENLIAALAAMQLSRQQIPIVATTLLLQQTEGSVIGAAFQVQQIQDNLVDFVDSRTTHQDADERQFSIPRPKLEQIIDIVQVISMFYLDRTILDSIRDSHGPTGMPLTLPLPLTHSQSSATSCFAPDGQFFTSPTKVGTEKVTVKVEKSETVSNESIARAEAMVSSAESQSPCSGTTSDSGQSMNDESCESEDNCKPPANGDGSDGQFEGAWSSASFGKDLITEFVMFSYDVPLSKHFFPSLICRLEQRTWSLVQSYTATCSELSTSTRKQLHQDVQYLLASLCIVRGESMHSGSDQLEFYYGSADDAEFGNSYLRLVQTKRSKKRLSRIILADWIASNKTVDETRLTAYGNSVNLVEPLIKNVADFQTVLLYLLYFSCQASEVVGCEEKVTLAKLASDFGTLLKRKCKADVDINSSTQSAASHSRARNMSLQSNCSTSSIDSGLATDAASAAVTECRLTRSSDSVDFGVGNKLTDFTFMQIQNRLNSIADLALVLELISKSRP